MKRLTTIISAILFVLCFSQCRRELQVLDPEPVSITLDISNYSKINVDPSDGKVTFEEGDVIYVACAGKYVGKLTSDKDGIFSGNMDYDPTIDKHLYFYFLGNKTPYNNLKGSTTSITVDIIDQTTSYPVISAARSDQVFTGSGNYTATLANKCALVKFLVTTPSTEPVYITGMNNKIQITFADEDIGTFTSVKNGSGAIKLAAGGGTNVEKWAILLEQDALLAGGDETAYSSDWEYTGTRGAVPAIKSNDYLTTGINVTVNGTESQGMLPGVFSVNNTKHVKFSKGNLRYHTTYKEFSFSDNEYGMIHMNNAVVGEEYSDESNCYIDMFGFGTSGIDHGATCYQPYSTSVTNSDYYIYGSASYNLYDSDGSADWGKNRIINGGNVVGIWRTLTQDEWNYVLNLRSTTSGYRYVKAKLAGLPVLIIFPDNWDSTIYPISADFLNQPTAQFKRVNISITTWNDVFVPNGAIFLPTSGYRSGTSIGGVQEEGDYWTSNKASADYASCLLFSTSNILISSNNRCGGRSVRLVCDVTTP